MSPLPKMQCFTSGVLKEPWREQQPWSEISSVLKWTRKRAVHLQCEHNTDCVSLQLLHFPVGLKGSECENRLRRYLIHSLLPAVLPLHHEVDAVGQSGQDPSGGGLECDRLPFKINPIDSFGAQRLKHWNRIACLSAYRPSDLRESAHAVKKRANCREED